ncbi:hypothetical protein RchiOBHm_Chr4g0413251 [Rosa chinensis]|uniref:Uncharacterized protein n=1 Tax=Rosa chinensis TaxID=74649 RepID=A0A2P6QW01_ROSCH|nr:hypothetical protein RchiOBHm_Chr4g0413251 [Rosa chinensis]
MLWCAQEFFQYERNIMSLMAQFPHPNSRTQLEDNMKAQTVIPIYLQ